MVFEKIQAIICTQFDVEPARVTLETNFIEDLGADSLDVVELAMSIEDEFKLPEIGEDAVKNIRTVADLVDYVSKTAG